MRKSKVALAVWLALPLIVLAALIWAISLSQDSRDHMRDEYPPVGAGANDTGGVNAIGELASGNKANHGTPEGRPEPSEVPPAPPPVTPEPTPTPNATPTPAPAGPSILGDLRRLSVPGDPSGGTSELLIWVPPGYDDPANATRTYPVLYLHDGQNLFGTPSEAPGEWRVDETATDLIARGVMTPTIIVGIPHHGVARISEYLPIPAIGGFTPKGETHVQWLVNEVVPRVSAAYRVRTGPKSTGVGGSSLGAVIALHAATTHPQTFGIVLAESLPLRTGDGDAWDAWIVSREHWPARIYLGVGEAETGTDPANAGRNLAYVSAVRALDRRLKDAGLGPASKLLIVEPGAVHNEAAWARRLPQALTFLFPPPVDSTK